MKIIEGWRDDSTLQINVSNTPVVFLSPERARNPNPDEQESDHFIELTGKDACAMPPPLVGLGVIIST